MNMPPVQGNDAKRLSEIENALDSAFEAELQLGSISQESAREALLDVTELLLTGQGQEIDRDSGAMSLYFNNLTKSASSALRQIERFAPQGQLPFLPTWDTTIRKCISTCSLFAVVEDAFFTCWKGYSSALIDGLNVTFEPLGSELDARLRFFRAVDDYEDDSEEQFDIGILTTPDVMEGVGRSLMATKFKKMGGFEYVIEFPIVKRLADEYERVLTARLRRALEIELGDITARDLLSAWCRLLSLARLHLVVRLLTADAPHLPQTSLSFLLSIGGSGFGSMRSPAYRSQRNSSAS